MNGEDKQQKNKKLTIEEIKQELEKCQKLKEEYLAGWQRIRADFLNYKREEMERISSLVTYAGEELILRILPILDNLEIAEKNLPEELKNDENIKGLLQVKLQLENFLKNQGVEEIDCLGQKFDPAFHEIAEEVEIKGRESGIIVEELKKGYTIHNRLLRPARVKITK